MAFAVSDAHSFAQDMKDYLSPEYAHYHAIRRKPVFDPNQGVSLPAMIEVIRIDGQPREQAWPYLGLLPSPPSSWSPPPDCDPIFRHVFLRKAKDITTVFSGLDQGQAVLITARISEQFFRPPTDHIIKVVSSDRDTGNHAFVAVGHGRTASKRVVLVRNSWGDSWADCGHIWVMEEYLAQRLIDLAFPFDSIVRPT